MENGIKRPQPDLSFEGLYKQAQTCTPVLENTGQSILDRLKVQNPELFEGVIFEMGPMKSRERALEKIENDYGGDVRQIKDLVRGRFVVDTPEQIAAIKKAIIDDLDIDSMKDKYAEPSSIGYRDLNTKVVLENGHVAEIQIQQRDMMRVNKPTHDILEKIQKIDRLATQENRPLSVEEQFRKNELINKSLELHNAAAHDGNLNSLVKPELRERFIHKGGFDANGSALGKLAERTGKLGKDGGVVAGVALGTLSGAFTLAAGGSRADAAQAVYEAAVPYGETQLDLAHGDLLAAKKSATIETTSNFGAAGGAVFGAGVGTLFGPGPGTAIGAGVGALGGGVGTGYLTEKFYDNFALIKNGAVHLVDDAAESLSSAVQKTKALMASWSGHKAAADPQAIFNALPNKAVPGMPPEVAALVEVKESRDLFAKRFAEIEQYGGLPEVQAYIKDHPQSIEHKAFVPENLPLHHSRLSMPGVR